MKSYGMGIAINPGKIEECNNIYLDVLLSIFEEFNKYCLWNYPIYLNIKLFSYSGYIGNKFDAGMKKMVAILSATKIRDVRIPCKKSVEIISKLYKDTVWKKSFILIN